MAPSRKLHVFMVALLTLAVLLAACGGESGGSQNSSTGSSGGGETNQSGTAGQGKGDDEKVTIRMWTFLDPNGTSAREVALKQIIDNFHAANPNITVNVEPQVWDTLGTKFLAAHQTKSAPDIIWITMDDFGTALMHGALTDFESLFLKDWTAEEIADVEDAYWSFGAKDGKHYQFTLSRNYIGILYREDLLAEKGIEVPFKTWDDLIAAAKQLTETDSSTGVQRYGFGQAFSTESPDPQVFPPALIYAQGDMFTEDGKANWSTDAGVEALKLQLDMVRVHGVTPETAVSSTVEDVYNEFKAGRYAMMIGAGVRIPGLQSDASFDGKTIQLTFFPSADGKSHSPSVINGWAVGIWSGSQHKEAAGKFVEFLVNPQSDELWLTVGGQAPVRKSTVEKYADFLNQPDKRYLQVMAEGFAKYGYAQPWEFPVSGWRSDLNKAAQDVLIGGLDERTALQSAEKAFNERTGKK